MELVIPERLTQEFATVHAVWQSEAATRGVDALLLSWIRLLLSWIKYEKQLRRLFSFLVFQHPAMSGEKSAEAVVVLVGNK